MNRFIPLRLFFSGMLALAGGSALAQQMPAEEDKTAASPNAASECPVLLQEAEALAERGRAAAGIKGWKDAVAAYRDASSAFLKVAAGCPSVAVQANRQGEKVAGELKVAEGQITLHSDCLPRMDKALDLDIRAASARSGGGDPAEIERLLGESETIWREAAGICQTPHKEKAERSLASTVRARAANAELLSSGPACDGAWKNATTLVELAKGAWKEKRWDDAGMLYSKAALAWEGAAEKCSGNRQQLAQRKVEPTQTDAHNAEFCGPLWEAATDMSQRLKAGAGAGPTERDLMSVKAEVAWREAAIQCKGSPQTQARGNADALARERGAPLPPQAMATYGRKNVASAAPAVVVPVSGLVSALSPVPAAAPQVKVAPPTRTVIEAPVTSLAPAAPAKPLLAEVPVPAEKTPAPPPEPGVIVAGDTTYRGVFAVEPKSGAVSGTGTIEWANGESFVGTMVDGLRQGKGRFNWVGGQWYEGNWQDDKATGQGVIQYVGGNRYEGSVVDGEPQGRGTLVFSTGDRYSGEFVRGLFHGQGSYAWKNGNRYEGAWNLGKKHGQGRLIWPGGDGWEGEFRDDQKTDSGKNITAAAAPR